ncbi:hypothetical protein C8R45DRAFT_931025 [Mycena sanguinolenta]|nr:hypothetical protein C8R45DRAFT_931025 [Mycena sanguinolenta]
MASHSHFSNPRTDGGNWARLNKFSYQDLSGLYHISNPLLGHQIARKSLADSAKIWLVPDLDPEHQSSYYSNPSQGRFILRGGHYQHLYSSMLRKTQTFNLEESLEQHCSKVLKPTQGSAAKAVNPPAEEDFPEPSSARQRATANTAKLLVERKLKMSRGSVRSHYPIAFSSPTANRTRSRLKDRRTTSSQVAKSGSPLAREIDLHGGSSFTIHPPLNSQMASSSQPSSSKQPFDSPLTNIPEDSPRPLSLEAEGDNETHEQRTLLLMSVMESLLEEYIDDPDGQNSLSHQVKMNASSRSLESKEIFDRGKNRPIGTQRFSLAPALKEEIESTVLQMQSILNPSSELVPGQSNCFLVDPKDIILPVLKGAPSLEIINIAWVTLQRRLGLADRFFQKYYQELKSGNGRNPFLLPTSTNDRVYDRMPTGDNIKEQLEFFHDSVHHHRQELPASFEGGPDWLSKIYPISEELRKSFPEAEEPVTAFYSAPSSTGRKFTSDRSSWGRDNFDLPQKNAPSLFRSKGKNREDSNQLPISPRGVTAYSSVPGSRLPHPIAGIASAAPFPGFTLGAKHHFRGFTQHLRAPEI